MRYWLKLIGIPVITFSLFAFAVYIFSEQDHFITTHSQCYGRCPTYEVWMFDNGIVFYYGEKFVAHTGPRIGYFDPKRFEEFSARYIALLDNLPPIPNPNLEVTDVQARSIFLKQNGQFRSVTVKDIEDGPRVPLVDAFIEQLESLGQVSYWVEGVNEYQRP